MAKKRELGERIMAYLTADEQGRSYRPSEIARIFNVAEYPVRVAMEILESHRMLQKTRDKQGAHCWRIPVHSATLAPQGPPDDQDAYMVREAVKRVSLFLNSPTIQSLAKRAKKEWIPELAVELKGTQVQAKVDLGFLDQEGDEVIESIGGATAYAIRILLVAAEAAEYNADARKDKPDGLPQGH